jgi:hypothetical protein
VRGWRAPDQAGRCGQEPPCSSATQGLLTVAHPRRSAAAGRVPSFFDRLLASPGRLLLGQPRAIDVAMVRVPAPGTHQARAPAARNPPRRVAAVQLGAFLSLSVSFTPRSHRGSGRGALLAAVRELSRSPRRTPHRLEAQPSTPNLRLTPQKPQVLAQRLPAVLSYRSPICVMLASRHEVPGAIIPSTISSACCCVDDRP